MRSRFLAALALLSAFAAPSLASAQTTIAYAVPGLTNMRAGPGLDFPVIAQIRGGSAVDIYGCLPNLSWCDGSVQNVRGWVSTTRLEFSYGGNLVPVPRYYSYFDAPTVEFDFGYWDRYYRDRPFYRHHRRDHGRDSDGPPPVTRNLPGGDDGSPPPDGGYRPYTENRRGGFDQFQNGEGAGPGNDNRPPQDGDGSPPPQMDMPPSGNDGGPPSGGDGGAPCPPQNPACQ